MSQNEGFEQIFHNEAIVFKENNIAKNTAYSMRCIILINKSISDNMKFHMNLGP